MSGNKDCDALETAIRLLARREHSALELRRKLGQRGHAEHEIDDTLAQLKRQGLQSDQRFAECYVRARSEKTYGPLRIASELRERGVDDGLIEGCIDAENEAWQQRLHQAHRRKFGDAAIVDLQDKARRIRHLQYRGFELDRIYRYLSDI